MVLATVLHFNQALYFQKVPKVFPLPLVPAQVFGNLAC